MVWLIEAVDCRLDQLIGRSVVVVGSVGQLVPAPAALTASAPLWCGLLQVHAAPGPSTGARSALRLALRKLLGCGAEGTQQVFC